MDTRKTGDTKKEREHVNKYKGDDKSLDRWKRNKSKWTPFNYNKQSGAGKGDVTRPSDCSEEEYVLRWNLAFGKISREDFEKQMEQLNG